MLNLEDIISEIKGILLTGNNSARIRNISIDTRTLKKGDLFVAIKGKNYDGHSFINTAIKKDVAAVMVSKNVRIKKRNIPIIRVDNTIKALGQIARLHRRRFSIPIIAITGSNGKTTTKEMVALVLGKRYSVLKNPATQNNFIGVPLALLKLKKSYDIAILELGSNHPGEIRWLTKITEPNVAVLTNIGDSHLEFLKNRAGVFKEKFDIVRNMAKKGHVIFNKDDFFLRQIPRKKIKHRLINYSIREKSRYRADCIKIKKNKSLKFVLNNHKTFTLKTVALHNVYNALVAISCGRLFKINYNNISKAISQFHFLRGRQVIKKISGFLIIDDTYNSNPTSFRSAIATLDALKSRGRKIIVFGDMLELGPAAKMLHKQAGRLIADIKPDLVLTVGCYSKFVIQGLCKRDRRIEYYCASSLENINKKLKKYLKKGDVILIKGSRGLKMERVVDFLKK